jgi:hypothetical protein
MALQENPNSGDVWNAASYGCSKSLLFGQNRARREKAENPEQSGSQGWDVFSSSSRICFSEELPSTTYL